MYNKVTAADIAQLETIVGQAHVLTGTAINQDYAHDELGGISQMPEDSPALCGLLAADWGEQSLQEAAGKILSAALVSGERADDMTVVLLRICGTVDTENAN